MATFTANISPLKKIVRVVLYASGAKRKMLLVPFGESLSRQMVEKIETAEGRRIYPQRLAIAEPVFANIRINKHLDRFTLRGKIKVNIQWLMYCLVHNIEKILSYGLTYASTGVRGRARKPAATRKDKKHKDSEPP
jgi:hypothetical protein